jgi:hypothetical protein
MDFVVDLDPTHDALRITLTGEIATDRVATYVYQTVTRLAAHGGPYAGIFDFSQVTHSALTPTTVRTLAATAAAIPGERPRVIVARMDSVYGVARMFELYRDSMGGQAPIVVRSNDEAHELLNVSPQDFSQRLFSEEVPA